MESFEKKKIINGKQQISSDPREVIKMIYRFWIYKYEVYKDFVDFGPGGNAVGETLFCKNEVHNNFFSGSLQNIAQYLIRRSEWKW